ncbi:MAG: sortase [Oscillospiraceae bacterium]|nr:sortase [Oscillospiraceae bacterium]
MRRKIGIFFLIICLSAVALSAGFIAYNIWVENTAYNIAMRTARALYEKMGEAKNTELSSDSISVDMPLLEINGEHYIGIISIPALSLKLPVNNALDDDRLKESPCRYSGDLFDSLVISAHNYKRHFGAVSTLSNGDMVTVTDAEGYEHNYSVDLIDTLHGSEVDAMVNSPYDLTLFTCAKNRTDRITVRCVKIEQEIENLQLFEPEILESEVLTPINGKLKLDKKYEVFNPVKNKWGSLPKVTANVVFEIRLKDSAVLPGKLIITYDVYNGEKSGIVAAEIVP